MIQNQRKALELGGSMCLSLLLFLIIYKFIPIVFSTNDDRMIAEIVSGQFTGTPESYGIQMTYGFTWLLSRLYLLSRSFHWYGILLIFSQIFAFGAVLYRLQSFSEKWLNKLLLLVTAVGLYAALWLKVYVQMTYTTTAAFVGFAAIFWYAASKSDWKNILMTGILANLAFSIRPNVFYMLIPATGLIYLWKLIGQKDLKRLTITAPFMILAVTLCLFLIDAAAYSKDGWKEFRQFFNERTKVYDYYQLVDYGEYPELYEPYGISEEEYNMMKVYDYTVLDDLPKEFFPNYMEAYEKMEKAQGITFVSKTANAVRVFIRDVWNNAYGIENTGLFVLACVLFILLLWKRNFPLALYLAVQCGAIKILWLYFTYWGRAIERIQTAMSLIFLAVILHVLYEIGKAQLFTLKKGVLFKAAGALAVVGILFAAGYRLNYYRYDNIDKAHRYSDVEVIKEYCAQDPDRLYFMDVATMTELYGKFTIRNTEPEYSNYISLGDWSAYCPHYEKKLKNHGVENVAESITGDNTYVVMLYNYQLKCLKEYLNVTENWEETIFGVNGDAYAVYRFD